MVTSCKEKIVSKISKNSLQHEGGNKRDYISSLGIYELRCLARELGIKSPTTKLREKLLEEIEVALMTGEVVEPRNNRKGRPAKQLSNLDNIISTVTGVPEKNKGYTFEKIAVFNKNVPEFSTKSSDLEKVSGILRITDLSAYFLDLRHYRKIFLNDQFVATHTLKNGDIVCAEAYKINEKNEYCVNKILSINDVPAANYTLQKDIYQEKVMPSKFLDFEKGEMLLGGRNYILTNEPLFMCNPLKDILETLENQDAINIFIGFNLCFEDIHYIFTRKNFVNFITEYSEVSVRYEYDRLIDAISFAARMASQGRNVNIIVSDIKTVLSQLDQREEEEALVLGHTHKTAVVIKKLVSLAGASSADICTSLLVACNENDKNDEFIKQEIFKIANNVFA